MKSFRGKLAFVSSLMMCTALLAMFFLPTSDVQAQAGTNWVGQFYNNTTLTDPVVATATYPSGLNFNWVAQPTDGFGATLAAVSADNWSARYVTTENFAAGRYEFVITGDDGYRLYVGGNLLVNEFGATGLSSKTVILDLTGGVYTLIVEHNDKGGNAIIQVNWFAAGDAGQPTATPVPATTGQVVSVRGLALRTGPYIGASLINVARPNKDYPIIARNLSEGIYSWYQIRVDETQTGWVSGRYFRITGDINAIPIVGSIFDTLDNAPDIGVVGTTRSVMNFRIRPSERTQRLRQISWGAQVSIIGRTVQEGRNHWYQVRYEGQVGWLSARFVSVRGNLDNVPIR